MGFLGREGDGWCISRAVEGNQTQSEEQRDEKSEPHLW